MNSEEVLVFVSLDRRPLTAISVINTEINLTSVSLVEDGSEETSPRCAFTPHDRLWRTVTLINEH
jgi:hypothetical protein